MNLTDIREKNLSDRCKWKVSISSTLSAKCISGKCSISSKCFINLAMFRGILLQLFYKIVTLRKFANVPENDGLWRLIKLQSPEILKKFE